MTQPLALISGVVSELSIYAGEEEFIRSSEQQALGVGAAAGLAAAGLAGAAVGASIAATSSGDPVEFFSCKLAGERIRGRFSKASFKIGDELTVVTALPRLGVGFVVAAQRKADQMLWMTPHFSRGVHAHRRFSLRLALLLFLSLLLFSLIMFFALQWQSTRRFDAGFALFVGAVWGTLSLSASLYYPIRFYRQWLPTAREAERIFAALGYPDPPEVDLPRDHKRYCKAHGIKWPYLTDGGWIYHYLDGG